MNTLRYRGPASRANPNERQRSYNGYCEESDGPRGKECRKCRLSSEVDVVRKRYPPPTASSRQLERQDYDNEMEDHGIIAMKENKGDLSCSGEIK
ncbi:hypothetical protein GB937_000336 [Aspergillus fischeri]|nr:hypothetical protein GB937_000336 [Aspergillus fischeri]